MGGLLRVCNLLSDLPSAGLEMNAGIAGARAYIGGPWGRSPQRGYKRQSSQWGVRGEAPPKAQSSVAFEAPAEEPILTLVTDSF